MKNEIVIFENQSVKLEVNMKDETVWLSQAQMSKLFEKDRKTITRHIQNIYKDGELEESSVCSLFEHTAKDGKTYKTQYYNLDMIISVGYRVKSKNGILFRKWANKILKDYIIKGYALNEKRLQVLEKTVQLIDIAHRGNERISGAEAKDILEVIASYTKALDLLDDYDHRTLEKVTGNDTDLVISYEECLDAIEKLRFNNESTLFAQERDGNFKSIIHDIYQSFDGMDLYKSAEDKCAHVLYLTVKNHAFIDGNKRIAATVFIYFLERYGLLRKNDEITIDNNTLAALTLLIAESNPKEKEVMIDLIMNFLK